jgi:metal-sulfur cluster biosynthetic enzyme
MTVSDRLERYRDALRDVEDPEIPISIVDMGLLVDIRAQEADVEVDLTLTAMGCPAVDMILEDVEQRLLREPDVSSVKVTVVWDPIWTKDRLTPDGIAAMREWGISV